MEFKFRGDHPMDLQGESKHGEVMEFQLTNWAAEDDEGSFVIRCFGTTAAGESVHLRVNGFTPYFFVALREEWSGGKIESIKSWLSEQYQSGFVGSKVVRRTKFFGFTGKKPLPFLKVVFRTHKVMRWAARKLQFPVYLPMLARGKIQLDCYESKLEPMLRFMHLRRIEGSGWVRVREYRGNDDARTQLSAEASWDAVEGLDRNDQAPRLVMAFDLECDSCDGMFPQAHRRGDAIIQIGCTAHWYNHPDFPPVSANEASIPDKVVFVYPSAAPISGIRVVDCATERELIERWCEHVERLDPCDVTGYYIVGFDFEYVFKRAEMLGVTHVLEKLNRLVDREGGYEEKRMSSSAYGDNIYKMLKMVGRNRVDMNKYIAREYKLDSYKLDNVANHFLGNRKNDLKYHQLFAKQHGTDADRAEIAAYCIQDCLLCNHLCHKLDLHAACIGMSNVTQVPFEYLFVRGQGIKVFSQVAERCTNKGYVIKTQYPNDQTPGYLGALVIDPQTGFFAEPVTVMDFSSLYPNIMISENISPDTKVDDPRYGRLPGYTYNTIRHTSLTGVDKDVTFAVADNGDRGVLPDILRTLLDARASTRAAMKKTDDPFVKKTLNYRQLGYKISANSIYGALGAGTNAIYDPDCAASVTAKGREHLDNARRVVLDNFPGTTCVYGDTDSIFVQFPFPPDMPERDKIAKSIELGTAGAQMVTAGLKYPMNLAFEKVFNRFVLITKKRYAGNLYEDDPDSYVRKSMGLVTKRRDNALLTKRIYNGILDVMLDGDRATIKENVVAFVNGFMRKLLDRTFPVEDLVISKSLGATYKDPNAIVQARLAQRMKERDPGNAPRVGDRVPYIFTVKGTPKEHKGMLQGDRVEPPEYVVERNLEIDVLAYIDQLKNPVTQLLELIVAEPGKLFARYELEEALSRYGFTTRIPRGAPIPPLLEESLRVGLKHADASPEIRPFFHELETLFTGDDPTQFPRRLTAHFDRFMDAYLRSSDDLDRVHKALVAVLGVAASNAKAMLRPYEAQVKNRRVGNRQLAPTRAPLARCDVRSGSSSSASKRTATGGAPLSPRSRKTASVQTTLKWLRKAIPMAPQ